MTFILLVFTGAAAAIEEQQYKVMSKTDEYEIRLYPPTIMAKTKIHARFENAGALGFRILADYLFGENQNQVTHVSERIEIIVPMMMQQTINGFLVGFAMPPQYSLSNLPQPNDARIKIKQFPVRKFAVLRYSGRWSQQEFRKNLETLVAALSRDGVRTIGEPIFARYNSALRPGFLRRNEVWLEVVS